MFQSANEWFGWKIEHERADATGIEDVTVQLTFKVKDEWLNFGPKFPAAHLEDLLHSIQKAQHVMGDKFVKRGKGWEPRNIFL